MLISTPKLASKKVYQFIVPLTEHKNSLFNTLPTIDAIYFTNIKDKKQYSLVLIYIFLISRKVKYPYVQSVILIFNRKNYYFEFKHENSERLR